MKDNYSNETTTSTTVKLVGGLFIFVGLAVAALGAKAHFEDAPDWYFLTVIGFSCALTGVFMLGFSQILVDVRAIRRGLEPTATTAPTLRTPGTPTHPVRKSVPVKPTNDAGIKAHAAELDRRAAAKRARGY